MTENPSQSAELLLLIRSRHPIILLRTLEEERAEVLIQNVCQELILPLFIWTVTDGLVSMNRANNDDLDPRIAALAESVGGKESETRTAARALAAVATRPGEGVYVFKDLVSQLTDPAVRRRLLDLAPQFATGTRSLIILSAGPVDWPAELERWVATFHLKLPDERQLAEIVRDACQSLSKTGRVKAELTRSQYQQLVNSLRGLTGYEATLAINRAIVEDDRLDADDLPRLLNVKKEIVSRKGLLEFIAPDQSLRDVGGLENLKNWLERRRTGYTVEGRKFGLTAPRGLLLLGVQGCGK
ncbi:MAG: hypothetical protein PHU85_13830, partial [Phycisphaerae bacterium]|nr:hypothetical protein [Phycisphaerae bacterium]